jgi:hypothetical protein
LTEICLCHACSCSEILRTETAGQVIEALTARGKVIAVAEGSSARQGSVRLGAFPNGSIAEICACGNTVIRIDV